MLVSTAGRSFNDALQRFTPVLSLKVLSLHGFGVCFSLKVT